MKTCINYLILLTAVSVNYAQDGVATINPGGPMIPAPDTINPGGPMIPAPAKINPGGPMIPAPAKINPGGPMIPAPAKINPGGPMIPANSTNSRSPKNATSPPTWPPRCCSKRFGCNAKTLSKYCLPEPCPKIGCIGSETCSCLFPGTTQTISPRAATPTPPRAPFCSDKPSHVCPLALFKCPAFACPKTQIECTYEQIQRMINN